MVVVGKEDDGTLSQEGGKELETRAEYSVEASFSRFVVPVFSRSRWLSPLG